MAFNAKNLRYEANEPSFLRKLRDQYGGGDSIRHARPQQRPRKPKDDDDDGPTYVYEGTNDIISKEEYEALVRGDDEKKDESTGQTGSLPEGSEAKPSSSEKETDTLDAEEDGPKSQQKLAEIGGQKKRKQAKVVGEENVAERETDTVREDNPSTRRVDKPKQKKKKIKLSFDEES
ncbi:hypothetical protein VTN77DRAFT_1329 [Rasamsonia byssochlamydoides]|uniref:uncharacterized protein n=1 Tax=Rasamsonia byssochlamydoides TaxID=89139 RepID=UPI0037439A8C